MKTYKIWSTKLEGKIEPIASKSTIHRSLIAALLSRSETKITNLIDSIDVKTTMQILIDCGCTIRYADNEVYIDSTNLKCPNKVNVEESGSTLRFIVPVLLYLFEQVEIEAKEGLRNRPHNLFLDIFEQSAINYEGSIKFPLIANGNLKANSYKLAGDVSSQFISGLLFVLPLLGEDSEIIFTTPLQSVGYLKLTIDVLKDFGIDIILKGNKVIIPGQQKYLKNHHYTNEIDESNIAFWRVANQINGDISFTYENKSTSQPDKILTEIIEKNIEIVSVQECPDLLPILAVLGCARKNGLILTNTERTKIKESNRLYAIYTELKKIGANIEIDEKENLIIKYSPNLNSAMIDGHNDHRIVMAMAISSLLVKGELIVNDIDAIKKSYPNFFIDFERLGGFFTLM